MTHPASPRNERLSSSLLPFRVLYAPAYRIDLGSFDPALTSPFLVDLAVRPP